MDVSCFLLIDLFAVQDGSIITAKLLIDAEVSTEEEAEHSLKYAEVMFQVSGGLSHLSGSHWIGMLALLVWFPSFLNAFHFYHYAQP